MASERDREDVGLTAALLAGGIAGIVVDASLYPIDTLKTRLQSKQGFRAAGGFRNVYSGLSAAIIGSAPNAAIFFGVYEVSKTFLNGHTSNVTAQMLAGSFGAVASCLARVPADNAKQKVQTGMYNTTLSAMRGILRNQGLNGFFVGFNATVLREMPFSVVQFTVWEELRRSLQQRYQRRLTAWESGLCGSIAGACSAALTCPIDVLKTRQMIGDIPRDATPVDSILRIYRKEGIAGLFSGFAPRIQLCFFGGLIFFSAYDLSLSLVGRLIPSLMPSRPYELESPAPRPGHLRDRPRRQEEVGRAPKHPHVPTVSEALFAGAIAGVCVDTILFPLDTVKTRLQSAQGFKKAGGFKGVYRGLGAAVVGSAPIASLFFVAYESTKRALCTESSQNTQDVVAHMIAGMVGETTACVMVVPTENVKQKVQAGLHPTAWSSLSTIWRTEGPQGLYRGYLTTVLREVPFSIIQYPIWEFLKHQIITQRGDNSIKSWESGLCGSAAGAIAATLTTPLDVVKTRLMLCSTDKRGVRYSGTFSTMRTIAKQDGILSLFSGLIPRVKFNVIGGLVFFSAYEHALTFYRGMQIWSVSK